MHSFACTASPVSLVKSATVGFPRLATFPSVESVDNVFNSWDRQAALPGVAPREGDESHPILQKRKPRLRDAERLARVSGCADPGPRTSAAVTEHHRSE